MTSIEPSLTTRMIRFQTELNRLDERLEICADDGNSVSSRTVQRLALVAEKLSVLADDFRAQAPEQGALAAILGENAIETAKYAGRLKMMHSDGHRYAAYWGTILDRPIANVQAAVDVLIAGAAAALPNKVTP